MFNSEFVVVVIVVVVVVVVVFVVIAAIIIKLFMLLLINQNARGEVPPLPSFSTAPRFFSLLQSPISVS